MFRALLLSAAVVLCVGVAPVREVRAQENRATQVDNVRPGDRWVYEIKDEITGLVRGLRTIAITEVSPKEIVARITHAGSDANNLTVYDRSWNVLSSGPKKFSPNDGTGLQLPLAVGKTWKIELNDVNASSGLNFKRTVTSRVVGRESITTPVGTVDAYVIEKTFVTRNPKAPAVKMTAEARIWYDAGGNYPVKRTFTARRDGRLVENVTYSLMEFGRRP